MSLSEQNVLMVPLVMEMIFQQLTITELYKTKLVCKTWRTVSENILRRKGEVLQIDLLTSFKLSRDKEGFMSEFLSWKRKWKYPPNIVLCVMQTSKYVKTEIDDLTGDWFPPNCPLLMVQTERGLVCSDSDKTDIENEPDCMGLVSYCNLLALRRFPTSISADVICLPEKPSCNESQLFFDSLSEKVSHEELKFLMIFYSQDGKSILEEKFTENLNDAYKKGVVILGCEFEEPVFCHNSGLPNHKEDTIKSLVAISFVGKNIKFASVYLGVDVTSISCLDGKMRSLKHATNNFHKSCPDHPGNLNNYGFCKACNSQTIGFVVANYIRGDSYDWYEEEDDDPRPLTYNQEQEAFRIAFPNVPLFGCYGNGELGASVNLTAFSETEELFKTDCILFSILFLQS